MRDWARGGALIGDGVDSRNLGESWCFEGVSERATVGGKILRVDFVAVTSGGAVAETVGGSMAETDSDVFEPMIGVGVGNRGWLLRISIIRAVLDAIRSSDSFKS